MKPDIDFKQYRYFYDGGIVRYDIETGQHERLYPQGFLPIFPVRNYDDRLNDGFDELSELYESNPRDMDLLRRELSKNT